MRAQDVTEYFSSFRIPSLAIGWAKTGFAVETAKSWARTCFSPTEAQDYSKIAPELCRKLKEQGWSKEKASLWGPFNDWTVVEAGEWIDGKFAHLEMKYWLQQGESLEAAITWRKEGITTKNHMSIGSLKISVQQWIEWQKLASLAEAALWIAKGFTPTTAAPWVEHNINPKAVAHLHQSITPSKASEWIKTGIDFKVLIE
ncbi:hypothetical protein DSO57_1038089 [Entomophthora muscae]|uniref:Uncharacterized protein n=1 Tax=Entomophthora muscae TaxID=34485 RepID=A0ACC2RPR6_9FUNG|nr:hypothetical protein DSO57_1038089 [Entomophthora muscae]